MPSGARSISIPSSVTVASPATSSSTSCGTSVTVPGTGTCPKAPGSNPARSVNRQASSEVFGSGSSAYRAAASALANRPFHLELDQPVHLDRVLERELLRDRLHEPGDDHGARLRLRETARHQV